MRRIKLFISTMGPFGYIRPAPGTAGTMAAVPLAAVMTFLPTLWQAVLLLALYFIFAWAAEEAEKSFGVKDPPQVVCDEALGYMVAMFALPADSAHLATAFFLFRFFDILKPPPVRTIDQKTPGGWGIVSDDLMAGIYARLVIALLF